MRLRLAALALAGALTLAGCETYDAGYGGGGYGGGGGGTQLSQCMRNALVGAGIGAVLGAVTAPEGNRGENAALGAAAGGLGAYGVCRWMKARDQANIERGYQQALAENNAVNSSWQSDEGARRTVAVAPPEPVAGRGECRRITATVTDPQYGNERLPPETYCRNPAGQWIPA